MVTAAAVMSRTRSWERRALVRPLALAAAVAAVAAQAPWSGNMHPALGFPAGCDLNATNGCSPTYAALAAGGALWPCPAGDAAPGTCGAGGCVEGSGSNPLCMHLDAGSPCCCPAPGCAAGPLFNWIVGVCRGDGCACGGATAASCGGGKCGGGCGGPVVPCCFGVDVSDLVPYYNEGTHAVVNYIAAYEFDAAAGAWALAVRAGCVI